MGPRFLLNFVMSNIVGPRSALSDYKTTQKQKNVVSENQFPYVLSETLIQSNKSN